MILLTFYEFLSDSNYNRLTKYFFKNITIEGIYLLKETPVDEKNLLLITRDNICLLDNDIWIERIWDTYLNSVQHMWSHHTYVINKSCPKFPRIPNLTLSNSCWQYWCESKKSDANECNIRGIPYRSPPLTDPPPWISIFWNDIKMLTRCEEEIENFII